VADLNIMQAGSSA